jgi:hypothetical protein
VFITAYYLLMDTSLVLAIVVLLEDIAMQKESILLSQQILNEST